MIHCWFFIVVAFVQIIVQGGCAQARDYRPGSRKLALRPRIAPWADARENDSADVPIMRTATAMQEAPELNA